MNLIIISPHSDTRTGRLEVGVVRGNTWRGRDGHSEGVS